MVLTVSMSRVIPSLLCRIPSRSWRRGVGLAEEQLKIGRRLRHVGAVGGGNSSWQCGEEEKARVPRSRDKEATEGEMEEVRRKGMPLSGDLS